MDASILWQLLITYSPCKRNPFGGCLTVKGSKCLSRWRASPRDASTPRMMSRWWKRVTCSLFTIINSSPSSLFEMPQINGRIIAMNG
ncbi:hypothetical protein CEXT_699531 [Caerostris extrusa]|uniref:Uncharacterized protein n=1 Tax=Caerostris extrusa TaxID=172846 RepID=A0AAV4P032_CAEEX|nr:hypothetical protein CEXT_699531 [Caerostris extrusa]